jgi:hypothetical protein
MVLTPQQLRLKQDAKEPFLLTPYGSASFNAHIVSTHSTPSAIATLLRRLEK